MQNAENLVKRLQANYAPPLDYSDYWVVTHAEARILVDNRHTIFYGAGVPIWCRSKSDMHESKDAVCRRLGLDGYLVSHRPNGDYEVGSGRDVPSP